MVRIRLQRVGKPHDAHYRIVAISREKARDAAGLEIIGHYHPMQKSNKLTVNTERLKHWVSRGAQPTDTLRTAFKKAGVWGQIQTAA